MRRVQTMEARFWKKVAQSPDCWLWTATTTPTGYGKIRREDQGELVYAHRYSWELHYGPVPAGLMVLHHCDTPSCVRPDHLFLGDQVANMRDMAAKGRGARQKRMASA